MKHFLLIVFILSLNTARLSAQDWRTDWDIAGVEAEQANKKLILVFSGSDWCIPCIKLEKEIWESPSFTQYAEQYYVLFRADFPKRKKNKLSETIQKLNNESYKVTLNCNNCNEELLAYFSNKGNLVSETKIVDTIFVKNANGKDFTS